MHDAIYCESKLSKSQFSEGNKLDRHFLNNSCIKQILAHRKLLKITLALVNMNVLSELLLSIFTIVSAQQQQGMYIYIYIWTPIYLDTALQNV